MAVTQIHAIKATLAKAIAYISNPEKTDDKMLISGFGCTPEMAAYEFEFTKRAANKQGGVLAHHLIQSFKPGEVDNIAAHEIGKQLAALHLGGEYEYVLATHNDKGHIHNHIIFNSVPISGKNKYVSYAKSYFEIRRISDELCEKHNLSIVIPKNEKAKTYNEYFAAKRGVSWKSALREALDRCIQKAKDWDEFLSLMQAVDYEIKQGKHISFRAKGQERFARAKTLGGRYSESKIRATLQGKIKTVPAPEVKFKDSGVSLIIDIDNCIKAKQSAGYAYWADMHNLKMAAMTVNYLTDNGLFVYENLAAKQDELGAKRDSSLARIQVVEKRIKQLNSQIKDLETYRKNKTVVDGLEKVVFKDKYKREHESEFILFNAAKQSLKAHFPSGKYPLIKELRAENKELYSEKNSLYANYYSAKDEYKALTTLKSNVDFILEPDESLDLFEKEHSQRKPQEKKTTLE